MKKLLPILLALIGTGAGIGAGIMLKPAPPPEEEVAAVDCIAPEGAVSHGTVEDASEHGAEPVTNEYVKLTNQFIVPVMSEERVQALVVASLSVEVTQGMTETVYAREPKLRDVFLQILFDHANIGGFDGSFTAGQRMDILRSALLDGARSVLGPEARDVLITEIARQDA
nr:flagellar basal body-associated FliL family protein [Sagittula stellata]